MATKKQKPVTLEGLDESIRDLGDAMTKGFENVEHEFREHDKRFDGIDAKISQVHQDVRNLTVSHSQLFKQV